MFEKYDDTHSVKNDYGISTFVSKLDGYEKKFDLIEVSVNRAIIFGDLLIFIHIKRFLHRKCNVWKCKTKCEYHFHNAFFNWSKYF